MIHLSQSALTPTPSLPEVIEQSTRAIDIFNSLGPLMALLFVVTLALIVVIIIAYSNRNSSATAISVLAQANAQKDKELADLKEQRTQEHNQHIESLSAIHDQAVRSNDLLKAVNERGVERDVEQKRMADDIHTMVNTGSQPVRDILQRVSAIAEQVANIDTRTADWPDILKAINPLLTELQGFRQEAKKHSTQPIPVLKDALSTTPLAGAPPS